MANTPTETVESLAAKTKARFPELAQYDDGRVVSELIARQPVYREALAQKELGKLDQYQLQSEAQGNSAAAAKQDLASIPQKESLASTVTRAVKGSPMARVASGNAAERLAGTMPVENTAVDLPTELPPTSFARKVIAETTPAPPASAPNTNPLETLSKAETIGATGSPGLGGLTEEQRARIRAGGTLTPAEAKQVQDIRRGGRNPLLDLADTISAPATSPEDKAKQIADAAMGHGPTPKPTSGAQSIADMATGAVHGPIRLAGGLTQTLEGISDEDIGKVAAGLNNSMRGYLDTSVGGAFTKGGIEKAGTALAGQLAVALPAFDVAGKASTAAAKAVPLPQSLDKPEVRDFLAFTGSLLAYEAASRGTSKLGSVPESAEKIRTESDTQIRKIAGELPAAPEDASTYLSSLADRARGIIDRLTGKSKAKPSEPPVAPEVAAGGPAITQMSREVAARLTQLGYSNQDITNMSLDRVNAILQRQEAKPQNGARVKMMITRAERDELSRRGFSEEEINLMRPADAARELAKPGPSMGPKQPGKTEATQPVAESESAPPISVKAPVEGQAKPNAAAPEAPLSQQAPSGTIPERPAGPASPPPTAAESVNAPAVAPSTTPTVGVKPPSFDEWFGSPKETSVSSAKDLRPTLFKSAQDAEPETFIGKLELRKGERNGRGFYSVTDGGKPVASFDGDTLAVDPAYRRKGIATELVKAYKEQYPEATPDTATPHAREVFRKAYDELKAEGKLDGGNEPTATTDIPEMPAPQPINPQEIADLQAKYPGRVINAGNVNEIRSQEAAQANINAGLSGDRSDEASAIREEHRAKLEQAKPNRAARTPMARPAQATPTIGESANPVVQPTTNGSFKKYFESGYQGQHQVSEEDFIQHQIQKRISSYERGAENAKAEVAKLGPRATAKAQTIRLNAQFWERTANRLKSEGPSPSELQNLREEYIAQVKKAISKGADVPQAVIDQRPEFKQAKTARERYDKGKHTSFANRSAAVNDTAQQEYGVKVKRQDGKPITEGQTAEITGAVKDVEGAIGPIRDVLRSTDLTVAHTSGKHPFMTGAGGLYSVAERTVSMGVKDVLGRPINSFAHEFAHWLDHEAGSVADVKVRARRGVGSIPTSALSEADAGYAGLGGRIKGLNAEAATDSGRSLIRDASSLINDKREARSLVKADYKDLTPEEHAAVERIKVHLGPYWYEPREVWARLVEQYVATKLDKPNLATDALEYYERSPGYWSHEDFAKLEPKVEAEIQRRMDLLKPKEESASPSEVATSEESGAAAKAEDQPNKAEVVQSNEEPVGPQRRPQAGFAVNPVKELLDYAGSEAGKVAESRKLQGGIYDLEKQNEADVVRARHVLEQTNGTAKDEALAYHAAENSKEPLTPEAERIVKNVAPIEAENQRIYQKLTEGGYPVENYVHRIVRQKGSWLERLLDRGKGGGGGNVMSRYAPATKRRVMMAVEDAKGDRKVVSVKSGRVTEIAKGQPEDLGPLRSGMTTKGGLLDERVEPIERDIKKLKGEQRILQGSKGRAEASRQRLANIEKQLGQLQNIKQQIIDGADESHLNDKVWVDKNGKEWTFKQATTKEIESNTNIRYFKSRTASAVANYLNLRKAERAYDFLENYKNSPEFSTVATKIGTGTPPKGWKPVDLAQFRGYWFEPHTAEVLNWYARKMSSGAPNIPQQIASFLRTSIFFNPLVHIPNITVHWTIEKGMRGFFPDRWPQMVRTAGRAVNAVIHQNQDFLDALDAGAPLQSARSGNQDVARLFAEKLANELNQKPDILTRVAGLLATSPAKLIKAVYKFSGDATWLSNDIAFLQAAYEKTGRGMPLKEALQETAKHIPDYRLPTRIFDSPALAKLMMNPNITMFGAYHYGALKSYGQMIKSVIGKDKPLAERAHGADLVAWLGLLTFVIYPQLDRLIRSLTGKKDLELRRAGGSTFPYSMYLLAKGERTPTQIAESIVTPQVGLKGAVELAFNRDLYTGKDIYDAHASTSTLAKQVGRKVGSLVSPVDQAMRVERDTATVGETALGMAGIRKAKHGAEKIAQQIALSHVPTQAEDPAKMDRSIQRSRAVDALREKDPEAYKKAIAAGSFDPKERAQIARDAAVNPLVAKVKSFSFEEAVKVWEAGTPEEKQVLLPIVRSKAQNLDAEKLKESNIRPGVVRAFRGMPLAPALDVWDKASPEERVLLLPLLQKKASLSAAQQPDLSRRLQKALGGGGEQSFMSGLRVPFARRAQASPR